MPHNQVEATYIYANTTVFDTSITIFKIPTTTAFCIAVWSYKMIMNEHSNRDGLEKMT